MFEHIFYAIQNIFMPQMILILVLGVMGGIIIGSLPGLTATMGVSLLLPLTFNMNINASMLLLVGVYIGAIYGGSISAILLNTPGTPASAATAIEGYMMSKRGEAGRALSLSVIASFVGGCISVIFLITLSPILAKFALKFSSPEYFALALFGLSIIISLTGKSILKGILAATFGLIVASVGMDLIGGVSRFTFNSVNLLSGFSFIPVLIGIFALSQALVLIDESRTEKDGEKASLYKINKILPPKEDIKRTWFSMIRSGIIGTFVGSIPGAGADIGAYIAYGEEKRFSKHPEKFGTGIPEGLTAPEAGNNGVTGGAMIPLLTLGIPGDAVTAVLLGAFIMQGLQPGPLLFKDNLGLVYLIFIGMLIGNFVMLLCGLLGIRIFSKVLLVPKKVLIPVISLLCIVGSYAINNNIFDVFVMFVFGIIGYLFNKNEVPTSPIILAMILGPMAESEFRRSLIMSEGNFGIFFTRPIAATLLALAVFSAVSGLIRTIKINKKSA